MKKVKVIYSKKKNDICIINLEFLQTKESYMKRVYPNIYTKHNVNFELKDLHLMKRFIDIGVRF